jgi:hypothetical protein
MRLADVMDEVAAVLKGITGLNVIPHPPATLKPPAGYVSYPRQVSYQQTYAQGETTYEDFPFVLVTSKVTDMTARDAVAGWASDDGAQSLIARMEAHAWVSCDDFTVTSCEFDVEKIAGVDYLAALFKATVTGPGKED